MYPARTWLVGTSDWRCDALNRGRRSLDGGLLNIASASNSANIHIALPTLCKGEGKVPTKSPDHLWRWRYVRSSGDPQRDSWIVIIYYYDYEHTDCRFEWKPGWYSLLSLSTGNNDKSKHYQRYTTGSPAGSPRKCPGEITHATVLRS